MRPGDLVFDVGAHVGDRLPRSGRLGARVVAVEPQPALARVLRLLYGRKADVTIEAVAVGRSAGTAELKINPDNPTVSTASADFVSAARGAPGWQGQRWTKTLRVPVTTLDALIAKHGAPAFIKIDVEGFEAEALAGLTQPVKALSFEFTTIQRDVALACVARCVALGYRRFNAALGESQQFAHADWIGGAAMRAGSARCRTRPIPETSMPRSTNGVRLAVAALIALGFGLTLLAFYPGVMTFDAKYVYLDIAKGILRRLAVAGDDRAVGVDRSDRARLGQHVPADRGLYWLAFGLLAFALARRSGLACGLAAVAGAAAAGLCVRRHHLARRLVWRDLAARRRAWPLWPPTTQRRLRLAVQAVALVLCAFGVLLRPNALIAAPLLAGYIVWPARFSWKRTAISVRAGDGRVLRAGAGRLLRRARCDAAARAPIDHGVRPRRHQPFRQREPVSR